MAFTRFLGATALISTLASIPAIAHGQTPSGPSTPKASTPADPAPDTPAGSQTSPAAAIQEQGPAQGAPSASDVVVTGSRIRNSAAVDEPVPVTTVTASELLGSRGDVSLGDALNQLPQLRSTFSQANSTQSIGTAGLNLLDLRGLGTSRTLTLINGRRAVSAVPGSYTPDVNTIPSDLVERVDLVTGGNSAIYGSDAVAGVANFVLRRDFEGIRVRGQAGVSTYKDRGNYSLSALVGHNWDDGRINVTAAVQYVHQSALYYADRSYLGAYGGVPGFITNEITTAPNRNTDGISNAIFVPGGIVFGNISLGGYVQPNCATATVKSVVCTGRYSPAPNGVFGSPTAGGTQLAYNFAFQPGGTLLRDDESQGLVDRRTLGGGVLGGLSASGIEGSQLEPGLDNLNGQLLMHWDFSDAFKLFMEGSYTHVTVHQQSTQPTFANGGTLANTFSLTNPFLSAQAAALLGQILAPGATTFTTVRFNNDIGTRAEDHVRNTFRAVIGFQGDISTTANLHYEVAGNYGRTDNFYRAGGNVVIANYNKAINAVLAPAAFTGTNFVLNAAGQRVVCAVNADASTTNDDAACYPLNTFGQNAGDPRAVNYILYPSTRTQAAEEIDATAYISGDTSGLFTLPGGAIGFSVGGEYREERAFSALDAFTRSGATFLNSAAIFAPPAVKIKEAFGELRVPLVRDVFLLHELTVNGAGRVSDYGGSTGSVVAWDAGVNWSPVRDLRFRATLDRSVRAPNLTNLYATQSQTFANGLTDPCDQAGSASTNVSNNIAANPNRARNCAAAGVPTTITYTPAGSATPVTIPFYNQTISGVSGVNQGNAGLIPEVGYDFTASASFEPHWVPGLAFAVTYYNIRVKNVISGLTGQSIINRCYDDPVTINNPFCASIFRRTGTGSSITDYTFLGQSGRSLQTVSIPFATAGNGVSFINQPFNFALLKTRGLDFEGTYRHRFDNDISITYHLTVSYVLDRLSFGFITDPSRYDRIDSTLGDPKWQAAFNVQLQAHMFDLTYNERYVGRQIVSGLAYEQFFSSQGRAPLNAEARPFVFYDPIVYHNLRLGITPTDQFRMYVGVDNITNKLPPFELGGNENFAAGTTAAIYPDTGRFFYVGVEAKF